MTKKVFLILTSIWWGWTALVDFVVIPTVFKADLPFFKAGGLGIALFTNLNALEVVLASALIILSLHFLKQEKKGWLKFGASLFCWVIVMIFFAYLTPKITELTNLWEKADLSNQVGINGIIDIQQEHQFYHRLYVGLDSLKFLFLSFLIAHGIVKREVA